MRKYVITLLAVCGFVATTSAQNSYYYYSDGNKVPLTEHSSKVVAIMANGCNEVSLSSNGLIPTDTISDSKSLIVVCNISSSTSPTRAKTLSRSSESLNIQSCYKNSDGAELVPDGYINVKLKEASDYSKLQTVAAQNSCEIVEQNEFMPLWYSLRVLNASTVNPVDAANAIYETGLFASSSPSFSVNALEIF